MPQEMKKDIMKASKYVHCKIDAAITALLADSDITAAQSQVLMCIMDNGDTNSSDVHRRLKLSRSTISGLIKKLRSKGYITFEGCEGDERQKKIVVTPKAFEHKAKIDKSMNEITAAVFCDFTDEELSQFHRLMEKMAFNTRNIKKREDD